MSEEKQCSNTSCGKSSCAGCEHAGKHEPVDFTAHLNPASSVKKVIGNGFASIESNGNFRATQVITREETCEILAQ